MTLQDYIDSINNSIEETRSNLPDINEVTDDELPSDFKLLLTGGSGGQPNSKFIQLIFDSRMDIVIDNLLNKFLSGDFSAIDKYSETIKKVFKMIGLGDGAFEGPIAKALMTNISNSLNSYKMYTTKNKIKKCLLILRNLKYQAKNFDNKDMKRKYLEAVHALKQTARFIAKIYKDRRIISNRVVAGLKTAVNENYIPFDNEELDMDFDLNKE